MTYAANLDKLSRIPITYVVETLDFCTLTFGVSPCAATGVKCFNTFFTCKDRTNYDKGNKDYTYCSADAPLPWPGPRPYLISADYLPTEIKDAITVGTRLKLEFQDEPDTDVGIDPYLSTRPPPILGTYFKKHLARNPNYERRGIIVYEGFYGDPIGEYQVRFKGKIDLIEFAGEGRVRLEAIDLLSALDGVYVPAQMAVKTMSNMDASQTTVTVNDTADLTSTGYIRIDDEIMFYQIALGSTTVLDTMSRGQFGTVAATHSTKANIQLCEYIYSSSPFIWIKDLLEINGGLTSADVNETALTYWRLTPGEDMNIDDVLSVPVKLLDLIKEIATLFDLRVWQAEDQKITVCRMLPNNPDLTYRAITDNDIIAGSCSVDASPKVYPTVAVSGGSAKTSSQQSDASRISRILLHWDKTYSGAVDNIDSYRRHDMSVDAVAESPDAYDSVTEAEIFTRWIHANSWGSEEEISGNVENLLARYLWLRGDPSPIFHFDLELKDSDILTGAFLKISTDELVNIDGTPITKQKFVVIKREPKGSKVSFSAIKLPSVYLAYIAPDTTPDWDAATDEDKEYGMWITEDDGTIDGVAAGYYLW